MVPITTLIEESATTNPNGAVQTLHYPSLPMRKAVRVLPTNIVPDAPINHNQRVHGSNIKPRMEEEPGDEPSRFPPRYRVPLEEQTFFYDPLNDLKVHSQIYRDDLAFPLQDYVYPNLDNIETWVYLIGDTIDISHPVSPMIILMMTLKYSPSTMSRDKLSTLDGYIVWP